MPIFSTMDVLRVPPVVMALAVAPADAPDPPAPAPGVSRAPVPPAASGFVMVSFAACFFEVTSKVFWWMHEYQSLSHLRYTLLM